MFSDAFYWIFTTIIEAKTHLQIFPAGGGLLILQKNPPLRISFTSHSENGKIEGKAISPNRRSAGTIIKTAFKPADLSIDRVSESSHSSCSPLAL